MGQAVAEAGWRGQAEGQGVLRADRGCPLCLRPDRETKLEENWVTLRNVRSARNRRGALPCEDKEPKKAGPRGG